MSNIAISEIANTVSTLNDGDLLLVSKIGNSIYTSSKMSYATLVQNLKNSIGRFIDGGSYIIGNDGVSHNFSTRLTVNYEPQLLYTVKNDCLLYIQDDGIDTQNDNPGVLYWVNPSKQAPIHRGEESTYPRSFTIPIKAGTSIYVTLNDSTSEGSQNSVTCDFMIVEYKLV